MVIYQNWGTQISFFNTGVVNLKNRPDTQGGLGQFLITAQHRSCGLGWEKVSRFGYRSGSRSQAGSKSKSGYHRYYYFYYCSNFYNLQSGDQGPAWELDLKPDITGLDSDIHSGCSLPLVKLQPTALTTVANQALGFPTPKTVKVLLTYWLHIIEKVKYP